jgi:hypothetical protein
MNDPRMLAILETGHREANEALVALKAQWARDDEETREARRHTLEAHAQGARDRDAKRVELGGESLIEAEKRATEEAAAKRLAAADAEAKRLADERLAKAETERKRLEQEAIDRTRADAARDAATAHAIDVKPAEAVRAAELPGEKA